MDIQPIAVLLLQSTFLLMGMVATILFLAFAPLVVTTIREIWIEYNKDALRLYEQLPYCYTSVDSIITNILPVGSRKQRKYIEALLALLEVRGMAQSSVFTEPTRECDPKKTSRVIFWKKQVPQNKKRWFQLEKMKS